MRAVRIAASVLALGVLAVSVVKPGPAQARCYTFQESHNGTDLFNWNGGAAAAATYKLMAAIEQWRQQHRIKRVRIGKVRTRCEEWTMDYVLPHHRCYARARVCR